MKNLPQPEIKTIGDKRILYVMATTNEYGYHLQQLFKPLITGVGPVESAIHLTKFLAQQQQLPDLVISVGSAGSSKLHLTDIYQVSAVSYRDMDASPLGFEKGVTPFLNLPNLLIMPCLLQNIPKATLSCGGDIISGNSYSNINTDMVEMETYSCLRACQTFNIPLIGFRGISDGNSELQELNDWTKNLGIIDEKLANILSDLERKIENKEITQFIL